MRTNTINPFCAFLVLIVASCGTTKTVNKNNNDMNELKVSDQIGIIDYWKEINKYTISFSIPNTIDKRITVIAETPRDIPMPLKKFGRKIIFSGVIIKKSNQPAPRMGGEEIYTLIQLIDIKGIK